MKLILFEDTESRAVALQNAISSRLTRDDSIIRFEASANTEGRIFEDSLFAELSGPPYEDATLIVADRDLSGTTGYLGLSERTVRRVADQLSVPECAYARSINENEFLEAAERRESSIGVTVSQGDNRSAEQIISIATGFELIMDRLTQLLPQHARGSPGSLLADVLEKPEYAAKISLFAAGDQNRLTEVLAGRHETNDRKTQRFGCLLGYWLWDSVLRFPGVVVNAIAAASYLNIESDAFNQERVRSLFDIARYRGPFAEAKEPLWWRGVLDDLLSSASASDGRELVSRQLGLTVERSKCSEDPTIAAGYYCMLSHRPVSFENSRPGLAWFPRGADLARISNSQYDELGPWI